MPAQLVEAVNYLPDFPEGKKPFTDIDVKEQDKNTLKYLNLVKETPQICNGERVRYSKQHLINE